MSTFSGQLKEITVSVFQTHEGLVETRFIREMASSQAAAVPTISFALLIRGVDDSMVDVSTYYVGELFSLQAEYS